MGRASRGKLASHCQATVSAELHSCMHTMLHGSNLRSSNQRFKSKEHKLLKIRKIKRVREKAVFGVCSSLYLYQKYIQLNLFFKQELLQHMKDRCSILWSTNWGIHSIFKVGVHEAVPLQDPPSFQLHRINKGSICSFTGHMFIVKQKQNQSIDSIRGQTVTSSFVQAFPRWTLIFFWSTSLGHGATDEVISCLFWSDLRDWLQMWGLRGRDSHEKR